MNWLIDAQLSARLLHVFNQAGDDAVHTSQLGEGNATSDEKLRSPRAMNIIANLQLQLCNRSDHAVGLI
jgi:predicted nuclease of predicted toxin-antitoxin system